MGGREPFELRHDQRVLPVRQSQVEELFLPEQVELLEAGDLALRERLEREVGQRRATPQRQRGFELASPGTLAQQRLEAPRVDRVGVHGQAVARRGRLEHRAGRGERAP